MRQQIDRHPPPLPPVEEDMHTKPSQHAHVHIDEVSYVTLTLSCLVLYVCMCNDEIKPKYMCVIYRNKSCFVHCLVVCRMSLRVCVPTCKNQMCVHDDTCISFDTFYLKCFPVTCTPESGVTIEGAQYSCIVLYMHMHFRIVIRVHIQGRRRLE